MDFSKLSETQRFFIKLRTLNDLHCYYSSNGKLIKYEKTYEDLRLIYSKNLYKKSKSDGAL